MPMKGVAHAVTMISHNQRDNTYGVILAGGSGVRFWPLSRELSPKQLLALFGTKSLLLQAIQRVRPFIAPSPGSLRVITNERLYPTLRDHLLDAEDSALREVVYTVEPIGRNTAPAIALMAAEIVAENPDAIMVVLPSDHIMHVRESWADSIQAALRLAADGYLVTIGLRPTHPETGFGYIERLLQLPAYRHGVALPWKAGRFLEKPDGETAAKLCAEGNYYWNAGIFVMSAAQVLHELHEQGDVGASIVDTCRWLASIPKAHWTQEASARFALLPAISIDKALMERSANVAVIPTDLFWNDVGSLLALSTLAEPDAAGNVRLGRGVDVESSGMTVYSADRLVATLGLRDLVIVDTRDATLICPKERCQDVRQVVAALQDAGANELIEPCTSIRTWGSWTILMRGDGFLIKLLEVDVGKQTGIHCHAQRSEHWIVTSGSARVLCDPVVKTIDANESILIAPGTIHGLANPGPFPLKVIEVQVGKALGESDVERFDDELPLMPYD